MSGDRIIWDDREIAGIFKDRDVRDALDQEASTLVPGIERDLASRARVHNGMKLLTHDVRDLGHASVATIHAYGPIGENIVKGHGIRFTN